MMTKEKYEKLEPGTKLWIGMLDFSDKGNCTKNLLAEIEKIDSNYCKVVKVESGTSQKPGKEMWVTYLHKYLFMTYPDCKESWNQRVRNTVDRITSNYESTIKKVKRKLL